MKTVGKIGILLFLGVLILMTVTGCAIKTSPEELYSLPKLPAQYTELENSINEILEGGAEYSAPTSGSNIQPVQMVDLDGDGKEEAVAFFRKSTDDKPLKIYIFTAKDNTYQQTAVIEGSGNSIYSIAYSDLDGDGKTELIVGWKVGAELQALSVYSLRSGKPEELMRTPYVKYAVTDLNQDQKQELVVMHTDGEGGSVADYYGWQGQSLTLSSSAKISMTMAELSRVKNGMLEGNVPALFVTGVEDNSAEITDILTAPKGELTNIALSDETGVSSKIYHFLSLYPTDINGDGLTEIPVPVILPTRSAPGQNSYFRIDWCSYDKDGNSKVAESTYHDTEDGWYLTLPNRWDGKIMVTREQTGTDEMAVTFSIRGSQDTAPQDFLRIYTITGDSREYKAVRGGRFILSRQGETIFAGELLDGNKGWADGITEDQLRESFNLITTEWLAGDY